MGRYIQLVRVNCGNNDQNKNILLNKQEKQIIVPTIALFLRYFHERAFQTLKIRVSECFRSIAFCAITRRMAHVTVVVKCPKMLGFGQFLQRPLRGWVGMFEN